MRYITQEERSGRPNNFDVDLEVVGIVNAQVPDTWPHVSLEWQSRHDEIFVYTAASLEGCRNIVGPVWRNRERLKWRRRLVRANRRLRLDVAYICRIDAQPCPGIDGR